MSPPPTAAFVLTSAKATALTARPRAPLLSPRRAQPRCRPARMSLLPFIPNWLFLGGWLYGAYRFYQGFSRTSYQSSFRIPLALAWPVLFIVNSSYRKNFTRSIGASDD